MEDRLLFLVFLALTVALWVFGSIGNVSQTNRFRLFATASLLSFVLLGCWLGWTLASIIAVLIAWGLACWVGTFGPSQTSLD